MIGTLTLPSVPTLRFSPENRTSLAGTTRSDRKMSFAARIPCKAAIHAFAETMPSVVETRRPASLYEVLRVKQNASPVEIKTAYRSLAKQFHPDLSPSVSDGRDFIEVHNAYATLSDPAARSLYDLSMGAGIRRRSFDYSAGKGVGFYQTRSWETDQCW